MEKRNDLALVLLTYAEAAELLSISLRQFRRLKDERKIPVVQVSVRAPRVRAKDIEAYLESVTVGRARPSS